MENVPHSREFFEQMASCRAAYRLLADCFHEVLFPLCSGTSPSPFKSVVSGAPLSFGGGRRLLTLLDIGCGSGAQTARMAEHGWAAAGVDVFPRETVKPEPGFAYRELDVLESEPGLYYDAVICTETAEHIDESRANDLVRAVTSRAEKALVWSAAVPGQEWEGHVNLQPHDYWIAKLAAEGWTVMRQATYDLRSLVVERCAQHYMAAGNFYVLVNV